MTIVPDKTETDIDWLKQKIIRELSFTEDVDAAAERVRRDNEGYVDKSILELIPVAVDQILNDLGPVKKKRNSLHDEQRGLWYTGPIEDGIWSKLKAYYLSPTGKNWPADDIRSIDTASSEVVSLLDAPRRDRFSTRGLVVGYVQSGKTANMTAVIAKAVDAGFRMIIILAGTTNKLREQTQKRLVDDVVDRDPETWHLLTDPDSDYYPGSSASIERCHSTGPDVRLFVVKKITSVLTRLKVVLENSRQQLHTCPTLIIDDESDQASINAAGAADEITATNRIIREIIHALPKVSYVGYTATPYANVLISPERDANGNIADDLYPAHFITALPCPETYFGAERLFGRYFIDGDRDDQDGLDMIRPIPVEDISLIRPPPKGGADFVPEIPGTLDSALRWFIIATAAKAKPDRHSTMLIHVTHLVAVHGKLAGAVEARVNELKAALQKGDRQLLGELRNMWETEYPRVDPSEFGRTPKNWNDFADTLPEVADRIEVVVENSESENRIDYDAGPKTYVAIGGHVLARGLTMEGLISSYFLRTSRQYDTLMQMGRWFGYRRGYEELPRLWASEGVLSSFRELATVEAEIREDIAVYREHNVSPLQFAVRIREIPGMMVTARNKMTAAVRTSLSFDGRHLQTLRYSEKDSDWLNNNWNAGVALVDSIDKMGLVWQTGNRGRYVVGVSHNMIIRFLNTYRKHAEQGSIDLEAMRSFVAASDFCNGEIWSVGVVEPQRDVPNSLKPLGTVLGPVKTVKRAPLKVPVGMADIKALMSRGDLLIDLPGERFANQSWNDLKRIRHDTGDRPLLVLYVINPNSDSGSKERRQMQAVTDLLGFGIVFPGDITRPKNYVEVDLSSLNENDAGEDLE